MSGLLGFLKRIGVTPRNTALYERAFRHVSVPHEHSQSYENLEFLGDAVIGLLVADYLVRTMPGEQVGRLTRLRAHTVNQDTLSMLARDLGFEEYIDLVDQILVSHHYFIDGERVRTVSGAFRYVWPSELDLMAALAGMELETRWADWHRTPFTGESSSHVSVWRKP